MSACVHPAPNQPSGLRVPVSSLPPTHPLSFPCAEPRACADPPTLPPTNPPTRDPPMSWLHPGSTFSTHRCSPCTGLGVCLRHRDHIYRGGYPCSESRRVAATWRRRFSGNGSCRTGGPRRRLRPRRGRRGTMDVSVGPSTATETTAGPAVQGARGTGSRPTLLRLCSAVGTATHAHKPPTTHHPSVPVSHLTMASLPPVLCPPPTPPPPHTHTPDGVQEGPCTGRTARHRRPGPPGRHFHHPETPWP